MTKPSPLIVLLQGPVGPFFSVLGKALQEEGYGVIKINFNLGDSAYSRKIPSIMFRDGLDNWESWFRQFIAGYSPAKVILFGDQRPYHQVAVRVCKALNIDVWCLEEGYIRPDYVTVERGGNNAVSLMSRRLIDYEVAPGMLPPAVPVAHNGFKPMAWAAFRYFGALKIGSVVMRQYNHHRNRPIHSEAVCWMFNVCRKYRYLLRNSRATLDLVDRFERKYFLVALQVHDDLQVRVHGAGWSMERVIEAAIRSFAQFASKNHKLVFKPHPLDRGHRSYTALIGELASLAGIADRVVVIDDAPMGLLLRHARGVVTVNSTSALLALQRNCPVFVMGEAFFRIDGLVSWGPEEKLNSFWRVPFLPSSVIVNGYINRLIAQTQVNGSFYISRYFDMTTRNIIDRLQSEADVAKPLPIAPPSVVTPMRARLQK